MGRSFNHPAAIHGSRFACFEAELRHVFFAVYAVVSRITRVRALGSIDRCVLGMMRLLLHSVAPFTHPFLLLTSSSFGAKKFTVSMSRNRCDVLHREFMVDLVY